MKADGSKVKADEGRWREMKGNEGRSRQMMKLKADEGKQGQMKRNEGKCRARD